jgi:hypothetical protein
LRGRVVHGILGYGNMHELFGRLLLGCGVHFVHELFGRLLLHNCRNGDLHRMSKRQVLWLGSHKLHFMVYLPT